MKYFIRPHWAVLIIITFLLSACGFIKPINFVGVENIVLKQGQSIIITADAKLYNPNNFKFKIVDSNLDVLIEGQNLGNLRLDETKVIGKQSEFSSPIELKISFVQLLSSGASLLPKFFMREFNVEVKGEITVKAFLFKRKIKVNYKEKVKL